MTKTLGAIAGAVFGVWAFDAGGGMALVFVTVNYLAICSVERFATKLAERATGRTARELRGW